MENLGNPAEMNALMLSSGQELERFIPNRIKINHTEYLVLTGWEGTGKCFWCGGELKGKLKRYCRGHMRIYYQHFMWSYARPWCIERQNGLCANCGRDCGGRYAGSDIEVHHIVPLKGSTRWLSAYNLPWNLMGFCHQCHLDVAAAMKPEKVVITSWDVAKVTGQAVMELNMTQDILTHPP